MTINSLSALALCISLMTISPGIRAGLLAQPQEVLRERFGSDTIVSPLNVLLTEAQAKEIEAATKLPIHERVFSFYVAKRNGKIAGYAGLLVRKIRTKDQAALYFITPEGRISDIELIAFYEPPEFRPKKNWFDQFKGKGADDAMKLRQEIRVVTGATLSAQSFVSGARIVLRVWLNHVRGKS